MSYAIILFTISVGFFTVSAVIVAVTASFAAALGLFRLPQCHAHFAATGVMVLLWLAVRFGTWSYSTLRMLDACATIIICCLFTGMYVGIPIAGRPELVLLLTMNFVLVTRAATVPSTPLQSLAIGVPSVSPTVVVSAILGAENHAETMARTSATVYAATWAGVVAYYLLTGTHVFTGDSTVAICSQHLHKQPEPPSERLGRALPPALDAIVLACLAKDPEQRPPSALALAETLRGLDSRTWTGLDAQRWWRNHRLALEAFRRQRQRRLGRVGAETVAVNLTERPSHWREIPGRGRASTGMP